MYAIWTDAEVQKLKHWSTEIVSVKDMATRLGRSYLSIRRKLETEGIRSLGFRKTVDSTQLSSMVAEGLTYTQIAGKLGMCAVAVRQRCVYLNIKSDKASRRSEAAQLKKKGLFRCYSCREVFPIKSRRCKCRCPECQYVQSAKYKYGSIHSIMRSIIADAKRRAAKKSIPFEIDVTDALTIWNRQRGKCYITGIEMSTSKGDARIVSIDRKIAKVGYTIGNVGFCCFIVNYMKRDMTLPVLKKWCKLILRRS